MTETCRRLVSWPMYGPDPSAVQRFWVDLRAALRAAGVRDTPDNIESPADLVEHWCDPALLLSQTCGYPFATRLQGAVRYVCTPRFRVEGCGGGFYRSALVTRSEEVGDAPADFVNRRVAYSAYDSHSGYNVLRAVIARHATQGRFFSEAIETSSHRKSLLAVRNGKADLAAIDVVTLALVKRFAPEETDGLRVIAHTNPAPGLPLITSMLTNDDQLDRLRHACRVACDPARPSASALLLDGVEILDAQSYEAILDMQRAAEAAGYPALA